MPYFAGSYFPTSVGGAMPMTEPLYGLLDLDSLDLLTLDESPLQTTLPQYPTLFEEQLAVYLLAQLGVVAYPAKLAQQNTGWPQLRYTLSGGRQDLLMSGPSGLAFLRVILECRSTLYRDVAILDNQLRQLFGPLVGYMGLIKVLNVTRDEVNSGYTFPVNGQDSSTVYRKTAAYSFTYIEPN